jgi:hypothetical protein
MEKQGKTFGVILGLMVIALIKNGFAVSVRTCFGAIVENARFFSTK